LTLKFTKMQGTGNDFVVIETDDRERDWSKLAVALCDRHYSVGADGLLLLMPSAVADYRMRIFNADGSEANTCGNGLRCLVKYYLESHPDRATTEKVVVETLAGIRDAWVRRTHGRASGIVIGMGKPMSCRGDVSLSTDISQDELIDTGVRIDTGILLGKKVLSVYLLSMGNPHAVYFTTQPVENFPLDLIGPQVERQVVLPPSVNFEVAHVLSDSLVEARVWEHGVGETLSCGSGACAIVVAARLRGCIGSAAGVRLPGGMLEVEWDGAGEVYLNGPAEFVFTGEWPDVGRSKERTREGIKNEVLA
jgi:diaminopimelate epimerase